MHELVEALSDTCPGGARARDGFTARLSRRGWWTLDVPACGCVQWWDGISGFDGPKEMRQRIWDNDRDETVFVLRVNGIVVLIARCNNQSDDHSVELTSDIACRRLGRERVYRLSREFAGGLDERGSFDLDVLDLNERSRGFGFYHRVGDR